MSHKLADIAAALGARLEGDGSITVTGAAEPAMAGPADLALAMDPKYAEGLAKGQALAAVLWEGADWRAMGLSAALFVPRPRYAMAGITRARHIANLRADGVRVHETVLTLDDFRDADEVFLSGNMSKVTPVRAFDDRQYQIGPITRRARALYWDWAASTK